MTRFRTTLALVFTALLTVPPAALAGPPLLCHPFDIGNAASLPWDGSRSWFHGRDGYDVSRLVADTEALLTPSMPVVVRMETLRRAAIYASLNRDVAQQLLAKMLNRAQATKSAKSATGADALANLDAAYIVEAFKQLRQVATGGEREFRGRLEALNTLDLSANGYALVQASLAARPDDPALDFAAALIASSTDRAAYQRHAQRARSGASRDALVASNLKHIS